MPRITRRTPIDNAFAKRLKSRLDRKQNRLDKQPGIMGDASGNLTVAGLDNFVYVSIGDKALPVFNNRVIPQAGVKVWVGYSDEEPTLYQVLSTRSESPSQVNEGGFTGYAPAKRYEWLATNGGQDPLHVHNRAISFLKIGTSATGGMNVNLYRGFIWTGAMFLHVAQQDIDLTSFIPVTAGKAAFVLITIDTTGTVVTTDGADVNIELLDPDADIPAVPAGTAFVCGAVRVYNGQTAVQEARTNTDFVDLRLTSSIPPGILDGEYLRLDASNDPLTGELVITPPTNVNALTANGNIDATVARTVTGAGGTDRMYELNYYVTSDNATANRFPYALFAGITTEGTTNFGGTSAVNGGVMTATMNAPISVNIAGGFTGRVTVNNASSSVATGEGLVGQLLWNAAGVITSGAAVTGFVGGSGGKTGTNLYMFLGKVQGSNAGVTNLYGLYLPAISGATTLNYAIFTNAGLVNFGDQVKIDGSANRIQEIVQGHSTQTANLVEWQTSAAAVVGYVTGTGTVKTSGRRQAVAIKSANYTLTANDEVVVFTATATASLPAATGTGQTYRLVCRAGTLTIDASGAETIKGSLMQTLSAGEDFIITDTATGIWE